MIFVMRGIVSAAMDLVFPRRCEVCSRRLVDPSLDLACATCAPHLEWIRDPACPRCGGEVPREGARCPECGSRPLGFQGAVAAGRYGGFVRELIHRLKFGGRADLARPLAARMAARVRRARWGGALDAVVPVPMRRMKILLGRRYNPAELLAAHLARELDLPLRRPLGQARATRSQAGLAAAERRENPKGAYRASGRGVRGERLLLVDDVLTTGATASACAAALRDAGADAVRLAVAAR